MKEFRFKLKDLNKMNLKELSIYTARFILFKREVDKYLNTLLTLLDLKHRRVVEE